MQTADSPLTRLMGWGRDLVRGLLRTNADPAMPTRWSTSLSDNESYPQACLRASYDYRHFNRFRIDPSYNQILESLSRDEGARYAELVAGDAEVLSAMPLLKANDDYGSPQLFDYPVVGRVSPTTLRYASVLIDLKRHFGSLNGLSVCEIGVGYGGQCRMASTFFRPATYCLVDIQPALALAQRYLDHYVLHSVIAFKTLNELPRTPFDLVMSNYAFSELRREVQDVYMERVLTLARRGYITYNEISPAEFNSYSAAELKVMLLGARVLPEMPLTHPGNCVIVWGQLGP